jgi:phenylacetate-CoA oxygenase PaaI subunit
VTEYAGPRDLGEECRQALYDLFLILADSKHLLGLRYGEWIGAPVIEASIAAVAMAQDEFGHARLFYGLLNEFHQAGIPEREEAPSEYRNMEVLDRAFPGWMDFVAANTLIDGALSVQLEALRDSSYLPVRRMIAKITQEEAFHRQHAKGWVLRIARAGGKAKSELERAIKRIWEPVLLWLGRPDGASERALVEAGIQDADGEGLRTRFIERLGPLLIEEAGLDLPLSGDAITGQWVLGTELSWDGFDDAFRRRSRTGPDAETFRQIESFLKHEYPVGG